jgi:hypothetical protein
MACTCWDSGVHLACFRTDYARGKVPDVTQSFPFRYGCFASVADAACSSAPCVGVVGAHNERHGPGAGGFASVSA